MNVSASACQRRSVPITYYAPSTYGATLDYESELEDASTPRTAT